MEEEQNLQAIKGRLREKVYDVLKDINVQGKIDQLKNIIAMLEGKLVGQNFSKARSYLLNGIKEDIASIVVEEQANESEH